MLVSIFALFLIVIPTRSSPTRRDLAGLLGGHEIGNAGTETMTTALEGHRKTTTREGLLDYLTSSTQGEQTSQRTSAINTISLSTFQQPTTTTIEMTTAEFPEATAAPPEEAPATPRDEATEWKVIGIGIMTITFIGTIILSIVFFDSWWGFLRDLVLGKRSKEGVETMVGENKNWSFQVANEDGHRYPTLASLEAMAKSEPHPLDFLPRRPSTRST
ncbi:hypothetical protein C8J56DRAFT_1041630 [Mycena floridula]|nr:hypothetical protein C8J56DRAFT_1041630 [Mycena floridula]